MLSVVIPTMPGREASLARAVKAYKNTGPRNMEIIEVLGEDSWPAGCNAGFRQAQGDRLHFSADDLEPMEGWWEDALPWLSGHDELPAPRVFNADGSWDNAVDGPDGAVPAFTRIPLMTRDQYLRIGPWPEVNYVADVWLSEKARTLGIETRMIHTYAFVHHWAQEGRRDGPAEMAHAAMVLQDLRAFL